MQTGVLLAFGCLGFSALNDFLFKLFAGKRCSRGVFATLVGVVWLLVALCLPMDYTHWKLTLGWGLFCGLFSIASNLLLIESMGMRSAGFCSTVFRLNLVPAALGAWLILGESLSLWHWIGVAAAVVTVLCFMTAGTDTGENAKKLKTGAVLVIMASLLRAAMGLLWKHALEIGCDRNGIVAAAAICWIVGGMVYALWRERDCMAVDRRMLVFGGLSGVCVAGITFFMAASLQYGNAGVLLPIQQMSFPVTMLLGIVFLKEKVSVRKIAGTLAAIAAILLLSAR